MCVCVCVCARALHLQDIDSCSGHDALTCLKKKAPKSELTLSTDQNLSQPSLRPLSDCSGVLHGQFIEIKHFSRNSCLFLYSTSKRVCSFFACPRSLGVFPLVDPGSLPSLSRWRCSEKGRSISNSPVQRRNNVATDVILSRSSRVNPPPQTTSLTLPTNASFHGVTGPASWPLIGGRPDYRDRIERMRGAGALHAPGDNALSLI